MKIISTNPAKNYEVLGERESSTPEEIREKVEQAHRAKKEWKEMGLQRRLDYLQKVYQVFKEHREEIATLSTKEMAMPKSVRDMFDIDAGFHYFKWYLDNAEKYLSPEISYEDDATINTVYYEPTGVGAVISPWNFPFCNFVWSVIPNLIVGNTVVFKHSEECFLTGELIEKLIQQVGLPTGVFAEVYGAGDVGDTLVHENVDLIAFTGSTKVGHYLYKVAAEKFIPVLLELGGSAPGVVFEDADVSQVVESVYFNRFANCGQICDGLKRLIVHEGKFEEVIDALKKELENKKVGDPEDPTTDLGSLVSKKQLDSLLVQIDDAIEKGAKVEIGGKQPEGLDGAYYLPTLLIDVTKDMKVWKEEVFGPVLPIVTFTTEEEAIALANDTSYGLGGYIFSKDKERLQRVASQIDTGMVSTNNQLYLQPSSPFGGNKMSGKGREHGKYGLRELCKVKVVATEK